MGGGIVQTFSVLTAMRTPVMQPKINESHENEIHEHRKAFFSPELGLQDRSSPGTFSELDETGLQQFSISPDVALRYRVHLSIS